MKIGKKEVSIFLTSLILLSFFAGGFFSFLKNFYNRDCIVRVGFSCVDNDYLPKKLYKFSKLASVNKKNFSTEEIKNSIERDFVFKCMKEDLMISIPDEILFEEIKNEKSLRTNGNFDKKKYDFFLDFYKMTVQDSLSDKEQEILDTFVNDILYSLNFSDTLLFLNKIYGNKRNYTINIFKKKIKDVKINEINEERLFDYYEKNRKLFTKPDFSIIKRIKLPDVIFFKNKMQNTKDINSSEIESSLKIFASNKMKLDDICSALKIEPKFEIIKRNRTQNDQVDMINFEHNLNYIDFVEKIEESQVEKFKDVKKYIIKLIEDEEIKNILKIKMNSSPEAKRSFFEIKSLKLDDTSPYKEVILNEIQIAIKNSLNEKKSPKGERIGPFYLKDEFWFAEIEKIDQSQLENREFENIIDEFITRERFIQYHIYHSYLLRKCKISVDYHKLNRLLLKD